MKQYAYTTSTLGSVQSTKTYTYGDSTWGDLLTNYNGRAITYDASGNMTSYNGSTYTWQGRQLAKIQGGGNIYTYKYNADGIRTSKTVNGTTTEYFLNGTQILAQKTGDSVMRFFYDSQGQRVGMVYNGILFYYLYNLQGDVIALVRASTGQVVARYAYDAWGNCTVTSASGYTAGTKNPFRYRGYYYDDETGLYYLNSRYYSPEFGRFISPDVFVSTGQGLTGANMFAYCGNNPVMYADPYGRDAGLTAAEWGTGMGWLPFVDGPVPVGDIIYGLGFLVLGLIYLSESEKKLPNQGPVSEIPDAPDVDAGKQGKHVPGHPNDDKTKSQWNEGETGVRETQEAWANGRVVKPDGSVRVGTASDGRRVKVHQGKNGWIHGYPVPLEK